MDTYSKVSKEKIIQAAANCSSKNKSVENTATALVDNRIPSLTKKNNTPIKQLKSHQAIADFNAEKTIQMYEEKEEESVHENDKMELETETTSAQLMEKSPFNTNTSATNANVVQLVNGITFTKIQREKLLARNKARNGGFHTCTHCGFRHAKVNYATYRGKRIGDGGFQIDHILHASRGGRNLMRNGRVLCGTCNTSRGNRAHVGKTGILKYRGLHGKKFSKNYFRKPR